MSLAIKVQVCVNIKNLHVVKKMMSAQHILRVGVIGADVSACAFVSFLKRCLPSASINIFTESKELCHDIPLKGVSFSSSWIRNDKKGRIAVLDLGKDILGLGTKEFLVSDVKASRSFSLASSSSRYLREFPSFSAICQNVWALGSEPFGNLIRTNSYPYNVSVHDFLSSRFGRSFAERFANVLTRVMFACDDAKSVPAHMAFPKLMKNCIVNGSVLLGPLFGALSSSFCLPSARMNQDVLDHLWQELMTGGKYVSMGPRLDLGEFRQALVDHVLSLPLVKVEQGDDTSGIDFGEFDILVSSKNARETFHLLDSGDVPDWADRLSRSKSVVSTRIELPEGTKIPSCQWFTDGGEKENLIGAVSPTNLFLSPSSPTEGRKSVLDVFSHKSLSDSDIAFLGISDLDAVITCENSESLPQFPLSYCQDMLAFNKWRLEFRKTKRRVDFQVVGKWFYAPSGSMTETVSDASALAIKIAQRYSNFPKSIENEVSTDYINRNDRSLDCMYSSFSTPVTLHYTQ